MKYDSNTAVKQYIQKLKDKGGREVDLFSNFAHLENSTKILVLDSIIDHAKDVFGPYSGVYGEAILDYNNVSEGEFVADNCQYVKTSDGASFFSRINFGNRYGVTILKSIQQQTKYLAGFNDNTSRDGTTSLAMVGALTAKNFLIYEDSNNVIIPKNIRALVKDIIGFSATSLMKEDAVKIYDADKKQYIKNDSFDGFAWASNAVNTTVGNTPGFKEAFEKVMKESVESGFDITSTYMLKPEKHIGNYKIDIEIEAGIKMKTSALSQTKVEAFKDNIAHTFVFGGFIAAHNTKVYENIFTEWLRSVCLAKDEDGLLMYSKYNRNFNGLPLILVTRMSNEQEDFYKKLSTEGFSFNMTINGQAVRETIRPIIMLAHDVDTGKTHYQDAMDVYNEMLIDVNAINTKINSLRLAPIEFNENGSISPTVLSKAEDIAEISRLFPIIENGKVIVDRCECDYTDDGFSKEIKSIETYTYDPSKFICRTSYDGNTFLMSSEDEEIVERMKLKRESLFNMKNNFSDTANADNNRDARINYMSGISLKPVIYVRTEDDFHNFVNLLDDALGVFQSIHVHGIMPGANSWILKRIDALKEKTYKEANRVISKVVKNKDLLDRYVEYAITCVDMIYNAYCSAYEYIDRENPSKRIEEYKTKDFNQVYNVITGTYDSSILEAARTTSDVFIGSLYVGFDIVDLKRVRVTNYNEWMEVYNRNKEYNYHKSNVVKGEEDGK